MPVSDPLVELPNYHDGRVILTGFNEEDFESVDIVFNINYSPWGTASLDDFVQTFVDYINASPQVASVFLRKTWPTDQEITPTEEP